MAEGSAVTCPECHKKFKGKSDLSGKRVRCPFCKHGFVVPARSEPVQTAVKADPAPVAAPAVPPPPPTFDEEFDDKNPYGVKEQKLWPRCPNCANEMESLDATICLNCGYNTLTREWGKTVKVMGITPGQHFLYLLPGILVFITIISLISFLLWYCLVWITMPHNNWLAFLDHESMRMWLTIIMLGQIWGAGFFCYRRFILFPRPPDIKKD